MVPSPYKQGESAIRKYLFIVLLILHHRLLFLRPIHQKDLFGSAGKGGVKPAEVGNVCHVFREIPLVDIHVLPLSALRLMAGHGIGILQLEGIVIRVFSEFLHAFALRGDVKIVIVNRLKEFFALLLRERGRL